jgi:chromate transporter
VNPPLEVAPRLIEQPAATHGSLREIAAAFSKLGCLSFGGPIAHLSYFHAEFVDKRKWLDTTQYGDLVALCQFLPGPTSSQVAFALGMQRAGVAGAIVASACFTFPSALLMIGFAYSMAVSLKLHGAGWLHGLKLTAAAVVAQAVWNMGKKLCVDRARVSICFAAAAVLLALPGAFTQVAVMAAGGASSFWLYRRTLEAGSKALVEPAPARREHRAATVALGVFLALLVLLPMLARATRLPAIAELDSFYRSGALVFGGGHVVLPLLRAEVVARDWVTPEQFLAGYGAAQALPGPLFTFAAYLGAVMHPGPHAWIYGVTCLLAIFLPAWLLVAGTLPFWQRLRGEPWAQATLMGANASVVGVLLAALYEPVVTDSVHKSTDVVAALVAFGLLEQWKARPWLVVVGMAVAGQWLLPT